MQEERVGEVTRDGERDLALVASFHSRRGASLGAENDRRLRATMC